MAAGWRADSGCFWLRFIPIKPLRPAQDERHFGDLWASYPEQ